MALGIEGSMIGFLLGVMDTAIGMGYGTLGTPLLLLLGVSSLMAVPTILVSQLCTGLTGVVRHQKLKNFRLLDKRNAKVAAMMVGLGIIGSALAVFVALHLPSFYLNMYIGLLVIAMGIFMLLQRKVTFSWKKVGALSALSGFNKAISGGGYGPVATTGLIASGEKEKDAIGVSLFAVFAIDAFAFTLYLMSSTIADYTLILYMIVGAVIGGLIGPTLTKRFAVKKYGKAIVAIGAILLGLLTILTHL